MLDVQREAPPADVAALLQIAPAHTAVHALRLRSIAGRRRRCSPMPGCRSNSGATATVRGAAPKHALYEILLDQGVQLRPRGPGDQRAVADPVRAGLLRTEVGAPLLKLVRLMHDQDATGAAPDGLPRPERSRILMDIPGDASTR